MERIAYLEGLSEYEEGWAKEQDKYIPVLKGSKLTDWLRCLKTAVEDGITAWEWDERKKDYQDPLLHILFTSEDFMDMPCVHETGFPCKSLEAMALAMLDIMPPDVECALDITDLINGGWTDSFEDLIEYHKEFTTFYEVFTTAITDVQSLIPLSPENPTLARLLYANVITAMETYLSDTLKKQVLTREAIRPRFVQSNDAFKAKISVQDIFRKLEGLNEEVSKAIDSMSFHSVDKITGLFAETLDTRFPKELLPALTRAVDIRHDIVHRNGKTTQGKLVNVSMEDVGRLIELVDTTIKHIDKQIKDGLLDDED